MGIEFIRRSVELAERYLQPGQRAVYTIQTNGTLLDDEWATFFPEHDFLVGISIDGPCELHDAYRVNKGGKAPSTRSCEGSATCAREESSGTRSPRSTQRTVTTAAKLLLPRSHSSAPRRGPAGKTRAPLR
jgi:hypothetical protein